MSNRRREKSLARERRELCEPRAEYEAAAPARGVVVTRRTFLLGAIGIAGIGGAIVGPRIGPQLYELCCRPVCERKPQRVHAVLIDCTDEPLPGSQDQGINRLAERFLDHSRLGDRAIIARLLLDAANPTETLEELCDPGRTSERTILTNTYDPDDKERKSRYIEPLRTAIEAAKKPSPQAKTPLVEGIKQLSASLGFHGRDASVEKRCLLVTDCLMNSGPASSYRENLSDESARVARAYIREFVPTLVNCEVTIGLIARHAHRHRQTPEQLRWFAEHLRSGGATDVLWEDIR